MRLFFLLICIFPLCSPFRASYALDKSLLEVRLKKLENAQANLEGKEGSLDKQRQYQKKIDRLRAMLGKGSLIPRGLASGEGVLASGQRTFSSVGKEVMARFFPTEAEKVSNTKKFNLVPSPQSKALLQKAREVKLPPSRRKRAEAIRKGVVIDGEMPSVSQMMAPGTLAASEKKGLSFNKDRPVGAWAGRHAQASAVNVNRVGWGDPPPPVTQPLFARPVHYPGFPGAMGPMIPATPAPPPPRVETGGCSFPPTRLVEIWHQPNRY